jgi:hypothetical protein
VAWRRRGRQDLSGFPLPFQFIIAMVAYAINERMARRVDYLLEEVRVLPNCSLISRMASYETRHTCFTIAIHLFTKVWVALLKSSGAKSVRIPASSPNCNLYAEWFVRTIRNECLKQFVIFGERHLRRPKTVTRLRMGFDVGHGST